MPELPKVYTAKEVSDLLKCGLSTVYALVQSKQLRAIRLRGDKGGIRILADSLEELLRPAVEPEPAPPPAPAPAPRPAPALRGRHYPVPPGMPRGPVAEPATSRRVRKPSEEERN